MEDTQRIVKCGSLSLHSSGSFFRRWQAKYLVLYDGSKSGIKRLELFDSEIKFKKQIPAKIIPLVECIRVVTCQRQKTTYTFEVRTNEQFYLLAAQSFQDMNDWVNCLRLVAFGSQTGMGLRSAAMVGGAGAHAKRLPAASHLSRSSGVDVLLAGNSHLANRKTAPTSTNEEPPSVPTETHPVLTAAAAAAAGTGRPGTNQKLTSAATTAGQAAAAAASALAKTRQRQPSLLGSVKPQPPADSPFIQRSTADDNGMVNNSTTTSNQVSSPLQRRAINGLKHQQTLTGLDEEEENMLYCSIEDNPSEHNYRVKVIETELSIRCQLKCYQLSAPTTISQQYEQLGQLQLNNRQSNSDETVTFYQLLVGPQELILLNDYASSMAIHQSMTAITTQQGLWSWPYQCIRRYGFDKDNCFMFEAGRKCTSGPGQFIVQTPKAYNIYQDVVAFVNKLRSSGVNATGALMLEPVPEASPHAELPQQENNNSKTTVTQIPVAWTPHMSASEQKHVPAPVSSERRKQFFNSLQQQTTQKNLSGEFVSSSSTSESPTSLGSSNEASQTPSIVSTAIVQDNQVKVCSEAADKSGTSETDESGYEQGDESVDSNKWSTKTRTIGDVHSGVNNHANKKRQQPISSDSMSSASSTSSGGSPGHSVSRRVNSTIQQQPIKSRPQLNMSSDLTIRNEDINNSNDKRRPPVRLGAILDSLARDNSEDFEANLIRDVYCEINKLHAKFTVASGSVDDSMSSHSSNDGSGEQEQDENNLPSSGDNRLQHRESVYSNLDRSYSRSNSDLNLEDIKQNNISNAQNRYHVQNYRANGGSQSYVEKHRPHYQGNSYHQPNNNQFDQYRPHPTQASYCGSIYPTILNPIPECGEPTVVVHQPSKSPRGIRRLSSNLNSTSKQVHNSGPVEMSKSSANSTQVRCGPLRQQCSNVKPPVTNGNLLVSKLPTKHYVINDVQYAKISRNVGSKIESCL